MTRQLKALKLLYFKYLNNPNYVFKSIAIPGEVVDTLVKRKLLNDVQIKSLAQIVILKSLNSTLTNLKRKSVVDPNNAQGRGNEFMVEKIIDKIDPSITYDVTYNHINFVGIQYPHNATLKYEKGKIVKVCDFDLNLEETNSRGIHFFSNLDCAYYQDNFPRLMNVDQFNIKKFTPNGYLFSDISFPVGKQTHYYYDSKSIHSEFFTMLDDREKKCTGIVRTGIAKFWHKNKQLKCVCNYASHGFHRKEFINKSECWCGSVLNGDFTEYDQNGNVVKNGVYANNLFYPKN